MHPIPLLLQQASDATGMGDVAGDHQTGGLGVALAQLFQTAAALEQQPQGDAALVSRFDGAAQIARPPALAGFARDGRGFQGGRQGVAAMVHPAILKAKFQRPHIARGDQLPRLHAQIGGNLLHHLLPLAQPLPPGGTEGQVVGAKGRAR